MIRISDQNITQIIFPLPSPAGLKYSRLVVPRPLSTQVTRQSRQLGWDIANDAVWERKNQLCIQLGSHDFSPFHCSFDRSSVYIFPSCSPWMVAWKTLFDFTHTWLCCAHLSCTRWVQKPTTIMNNICSTFRPLNTRKNRHCQWSLGMHCRISSTLRISGDVTCPPYLGLRSDQWLKVFSLLISSTLLIFVWWC